MDDASLEQPRRGTQFSLLGAFLLMTIVGLGLAVTLLWREVRPLREENRRMRVELGELTIEDPQHAYAISMPSSNDNTWKWRIYLPPEGEYSLQLYTGTLPNSSGPDRKEWVKEARIDGVGSSIAGTGLQGEFVLEAALVEANGVFTLQTTNVRRDGGKTATSRGTISLDQSTSKWLADRRSRVVFTDVSASQRSFEAGDPILLLHVPRPVEKVQPGGGVTSEAPKGPAEAFAVWIERVSE